MTTVYRIDDIQMWQYKNNVRKNEELMLVAKNNL